MQSINVSCYYFGITAKCIIIISIIAPTVLPHTHPLALEYPFFILHPLLSKSYLPLGAVSDSILHDILIDVSGWN
jgi:hypothetical protein